MTASPPTKSALLASLPAPWLHDVFPELQEQVARCGAKVVVLDDDPTGTQTVHDVPVLTTWDIEALEAELAAPGNCFYVLTNSRALSSTAAAQLAAEVACNLSTAARHSNRRYVVISRSDSTLRGHYPAETDAFANVLSRLGGRAFDATVILPFFEAGGRITVDDVHYVADGESVVPVAETQFASDAVFGFRSSNLREWVAEKSGGRIAAPDVLSISLHELRKGGPEAVAERLLTAPSGNVFVVNAACARDVEVFALAAVNAEIAGRSFLYRTAASFVAARAGLRSRPLLNASDLALGDKGMGGLVVVGSYVPKTSSQLTALLAVPDLVPVEIDVEELLQSGAKKVVTPILSGINESILNGRTCVLFTSRRLITGASSEENLRIGASVSAALVEVVSRLQTRPRWVIAKGGITSSDVATRGLRVRRAIVVGQLLPGVPVWQLGAESRFPDLTYVVFPGNVGDANALKSAVETLS